MTPTLTRGRAQQSALKNMTKPSNEPTTEPNNNNNPLILGENENVPTKTKETAQDGGLRPQQRRETNEDATTKSTSTMMQTLDAEVQTRDHTDNSGITGKQWTATNEGSYEDTTLTVHTSPPGDKDENNSQINKIIRSGQDQTAAGRRAQEATLRA